MKQEYIIYVKSKGVKKLEKDFEAAGSRADVLVAKAGALNTAFTTTATAINANLAGIERYRKSLLGIKAPGVAPYKTITAELKAAELQAKALKAALAAPIPVNIGANAVKAAIPNQPRPGTVFTGMPSLTEQEKNVERFNQRQQMQSFNSALKTQEQITGLSKEELAAVESTGKYKMRTAAANKEILRTEKIRNGIIASQMQQEEKLNTLRKNKKNMTFDEFRTEEHNLKRSIEMHERERRIWSKKVNAAKEYAQTLRYPSGQHPIDSGIRDIERDVKASNAAANRKQGQDKYNESLDKTGKLLNDNNKKMDDAGKRTNFLNSRFAKFSIIMSGIAATLFVWQTVVRVITSIVRLGTDMETSYAMVSHTLGLAADEMERLKTNAEEQQAIGGPNVKEYTALVTQFVKGGYELDEATKLVNKAYAKQAELLEGTFVQDLKEHSGAWKEFGTEAYKSAVKYGKGLDLLTSFIRKFTKSGALEGVIQTPTNPLAGAVANLRPLKEAQKEIAESQKGWFDELKEIASEYGEWEWNMWEKLLGKRAEHVPFARGPQEPAPDNDAQGAAKYFDFDADEVLDPVLQPALPAELDNIMKPALSASKDIREEWELLKQEMDKVELTEEEIVAQGKNLEKHIKTASDILGRYTVAQLKEVNKETMLIIKNLEGTNDFTQEQMLAIEAVLRSRARAMEIAPLINVWKDYLNKVGIMDDAYFEERKQKILDKFKAQAAALKPEDIAPAEAIRDEDLFRNERARVAGSLKVWQEYHQMLGIMTEEEYNERQIVIDHQYKLDLNHLKKHQADKLKAQREYMLEVDRQKGPQEFWKRVYSELGKMSDQYIENERAKIENEYSRNKLVPGGEEAAQILRKRQLKALDMQAVFHEALGDYTKDEIEALEKLFNETGIATEKLSAYWRLRDEFEARRAGSMVGRVHGPAVEEEISSARAHQRYIKENQKMVSEAEKAFELLGTMDEKYKNYRIANIKYAANEYKNSLMEQGVATEVALRKRQEYEDAAMRKFTQEEFAPTAELLERGLDDARVMTEELYQWKAQQYALDRDNFIARTHEKEIAEKIYQNNMRRLEMERLATSQDANDGMTLAALKALDSQMTGAEKAAKRTQEFVRGTTDVTREAIFGTLQGEFTTLWDFFDQTANNFKRMVDQMVAKWISEQLANMMFGDLAGAGSGTWGLLGSGMNLLSSVFGGPSGPGPVVTSGNPADFLAADGMAFDRGGVHKFAMGGVVDRAQMFSFAGGYGEMGEEGPEGILPLKRMSDGKLGVSTEATINGRTVNIAPTIIVQAPEGRLPRESMNQLTNQIGKTIQRSVGRNS